MKPPVPSSLASLASLDNMLDMIYKTGLLYFLSNESLSEHQNHTIHMTDKRTELGLGAKLNSGNRPKITRTIWNLSTTLHCLPAYQPASQRHTAP